MSSKYLNIQGRIIDLLVPFRNFYYYNPSQKGSCSIKKVLPAVTGKDYSELNINNGEIASLKFVEMTYGDFEGDPNELREDLEKYCKLDTVGMVWIVEELFQIISEKS